MATYTQRTAADRHPVIAGFVMFVLGLVLAWIPIVGPAIAGFVGGRIAGDRRTALGVSLLPSIVLAIAVAAVLSLVALPLVGAVAGAAVLVWAVLGAAPVAIGAYIGGATVERG